MKVIIAGGRDWDNQEYLNLICTGFRGTITEVVSGGQRSVDNTRHRFYGADYQGEQWALENDIPVKQFPADWKEHGRAAGPIRNRQMAEYADAVILFPGGRGTANMRSLAIKYGLNILWEEQ